MNDTFTSNMYVTGQHKNKQISDRLEYITHLHQHTWSIHNSYVSKNVHTKYRKYFRGFLNSRLLKNREIRWKLMYREYFHVYSNCDYFYF